MSASHLGSVRLSRAEVILPPYQAQADPPFQGCMECCYYPNIASMRKWSTSTMMGTRHMHVQAKELLPSPTSQA